MVRGILLIHGLYTPLLKRIIENATIDCRESKETEVTITHLFMSLLEEGDGVAIRILIGMNVDVDLLYDEFSANLLTKKSKGKHKLMIDGYSVDLNKKCLSGDIDPVVGRDKEINNIIEILIRRAKNNPLLIGEAGVGKTSIVEELANRIVSDMVPDKLKNKRVLSVSMSSLVAGTKYRGEFEERINKLLTEIEENDDIIMFIDEIHTLVGAGGAEGAIDASNILKPALARGKIKIIGATTGEEYSKYFEKDKALDRRFQNIIVSEPSNKKTNEILHKIKPLYESFHNVIISDEIIDYIVDLSDKYIHNRNFPDKAIDILDEVCVKTSLENDNVNEKINSIQQKLKLIVKEKKDAIIQEKFDNATELKNEQNKYETKLNKIKLKNITKNNPKVITKKSVLNVISNKTAIPFFEKSTCNKTISSLKEKLNNSIVGQNESIDNICEYTKRLQFGLINNKVHSFLLIGKTGVGKTLLVKEYAKLLYDKNNFIRMDMTEFKEKHSISKIIGSPPGYIGYDDNNYLLEKVKNNPYCVLLLDEIEKANLDVIKLFLQVLDEGKIKDSKGQTVYFNNVVIFMTSNLYCEDQQIGFSNNKNSLIEKLNKFFSTEFVNRIDDVLIFNSLKKADIETLVKKKLNILKKKYLEKNIKLSFSSKIIKKICDECDYEKYGARKIDKVIDKKINNYIINEILIGKENINVVEV